MATRWFVLLSLILAATDQLTKHLARTGLEQHRPHEIIPDFFRITLNYNEGIAWGMLPQWSEYFTYFAIIMVLVILMIMRKLDRDEVWLKIALSFQMAGAIGNMTDRLLYHKVTDFLDVTLFPNTRWSYDWPIFNLADSYVVVGTFVLVLVLLFTREPVADTQPSAFASPHLQPEDNGDTQRYPGSVSSDEALIEISVECESEMLCPFEDADLLKGEQIAGELGRMGDDEEVSPQHSELDSKDKLDELSRRPEPGNID